MAKEARVPAHKTAPHAMALHGSLSEETIHKINSSISQKFRSGELPRPKSVRVNYPEWTVSTLAIPKSHKAIIGSGTQHVVLDAGVHNTEHGKLHLVIKLPLLREPIKPLNAAELEKLHVTSPSAPSPSRMEVAAAVLRGEGLPVPLVHAIPFGPNSSALIMEHPLPGEKLREIDDIKFTGKGSLKNGSALRTELDSYITRLDELQKKSIISSIEHGGNLDKNKVFERSFSVLVGKDGLGRLVMADPHFTPTLITLMGNPSIAELQDKVRARLGFGTGTLIDKPGTIEDMREAVLARMGLKKSAPADKPGKATKKPKTR